jgi:hypothetical protein
MKESKPCDPIPMLKHPNSKPPVYARRSNEMAKLARDYHAGTQLNITEDDPITKKSVIDEVLQSVNRSASPPENDSMKPPLKEEEV